MNIMQQVIAEMGGYGEFAKAMKCNQNTTALREIAEGKRVPAPTTRRRIVAASLGRLTEGDVIEITGMETRPVFITTGTESSGWGLPDDDRKIWITTRAAKAAAAARRALESP